MERRKIFKKAAAFIFIIFAVNFIGSFFHWYTSIWFFDMIMHYLGGLWLGFMYVWLLYPEKFNVKEFIIVISGILFIGVAWEVFEVVVNNNTLQSDLDYADIFSDIFFDLAGGVTAFVYFAKKALKSYNNSNEYNT